MSSALLFCLISSQTVLGKKLYTQRKHLWQQFWAATGHTNPWTEVSPGSGAAWGVGETLWVTSVLTWLMEPQRRVHIVTHYSTWLQAKLWGVHRLVAGPHPQQTAFQGM